MRHNGDLPGRDELKKIGSSLIPVMIGKLDDKINELFLLSEKKIDKKKDFFKQLLAKMKSQDALMEEIRVLARKLDTMKGRMIKFPRGDGYAIYIITKVNTKTVQIEWLDYGDAWMDDRCGECARINIFDAAKMVKFDDFWADAADKKRQKQLKTS